MNERIRKIAIETDAWCDQHYTGDQMYDIKWEQKFAELIVAECLAHGKLTQSQAVVNGSEAYNAGREMGIEVFMNKIRNHFGVEE